MLRMGTRRTRLWGGAAAVAALTVGVLLGGAFAPRSEAAAQPSVGFTGEVGIILNVVDPSKAADFERVMDAYIETLRSSDDAQRARMGSGLKVYRAAEAGPNNFALYYLVADPVVSGGNYAVAQILADEYMGGPPENGDEVRELYEAYTGSLQGGGQQPINLNAVVD